MSGALPLLPLCFLLRGQEQICTHKAVCSGVHPGRGEKKKKKDLNFLACRDPDLAQCIPYPNRYINYATLQQASYAMCV